MKVERPSNSSSPHSIDEAAGARAGELPSLRECADQLNRLALGQVSGGGSGAQGMKATLDGLIRHLQAHSDALGREITQPNERTAEPATRILDIDNAGLRTIISSLDGGSLRALRVVSRDLRRSVDDNVATLKPGEADVSDFPAMLKRFPNVTHADLSGLQPKPESLYSVLPHLPAIADLREVLLPELSPSQCLRVFEALGRCASLRAFSGTASQERLKFAGKPLHWYPDIYCVGADALGSLSGLKKLERLDDLRLFSPEDIRLLGNFSELASVRALITNTGEAHVDALAELLSALPRHRALDLDLVIQQTQPISAAALARLSQALPERTILKLRVYGSDKQRAVNAEWGQLSQPLSTPHDVALVGPARQILVWPGRSG